MTFLTVQILLFDGRGSIEVVVVVVVYLRGCISILYVIIINLANSRTILSQVYEKNDAIVLVGEW